MLLALVACQESSDYEQTESGLKYRFVTQNEDGVQPQNGDILSLDLTMVGPNDSILMQAQDMPLQKNDEVWNQTPGGIEEAFSLLSEGDSLIAVINAGDLYQRSWRMPIPPAMSESDEITCQIKLNEIMDEAGYRRKEAMARISQVESYRQQQLEQFSGVMDSDGETIDAYLAKNNIEAQTTETGLRYVIIEEGSGPTPEIGDMVKVNYTGNILEGEYFDTSVEEKAQELGMHNPQRPYQPFEFILGTGGVIHGWDEGISLMNKGAKARLYIPSPMAYGDQQRSEIIVPNSILEFEVELVDFEPAN